MPSLTTTEMKMLFSMFPGNYPLFIETGTYHAETAVAMSTLFKKVHTIEIDYRLVNNAKSKYSDYNIDFHLGDSVQIFSSLLPSLDENSVFWLDGHWSAGYDAGKGPKDCPLLDELDRVMKEFKNDCIVVIDDCRLFGTKIVEDWREITSDNIFKIVEDRILSSYFFPSTLHPQDRLALRLKSLN